MRRRKKKKRKTSKLLTKRAFVFWSSSLHASHRYARQRWSRRLHQLDARSQARFKRSILLFRYKHDKKFKEFNIKSNQRTRSFARSKMFATASQLILASFGFIGIVKTFAKKCGFCKLLLNRMPSFSCALEFIYALFLAVYATLALAGVALNALWASALFASRRQQGRFAFFIIARHIAFCNFCGALALLVITVPPAAMSHASAAGEKMSQRGRAANRVCKRRACIFQCIVAAPFSTRPPAWK